MNNFDGIKFISISAEWKHALTCKMHKSTQGKMAQCTLNYRMDINKSSSI